jgi:hypothetical protein
MAARRCEDRDPAGSGALHPRRPVGRGACACPSAWRMQQVIKPSGACVDAALPPGGVALAGGIGGDGHALALADAHDGVGAVVRSWTPAW